MATAIDESKKAKIIRRYVPTVVKVGNTGISDMPDGLTVQNKPKVRLLFGYRLEILNPSCKVRFLTHRFVVTILLKNGGRVRKYTEQTDRVAVACGKVCWFKVQP